MNRLFQDPAGLFGGMGQSRQWAPSIDVEETDDAYIVDMELPGAKKEDVSIGISGNEVRVYGEIKQRQRKGILRRHTRKVGEFDARVSLPSDVDPDKIDAESHGIRQTWRRDGLPGSDGESGTASVAIASNEAFSGWARTFTNPRLCAAIVDRLTFAGNIIETGTNSYRLAHARAQQQATTTDRPVGH